MNNPYWHFYKTIFPFIASFAIVATLLVGPWWGFLIFITIGLFAGFVGFKAFYNNQYYFYYNLGLTKWKLFKVSFLLNIIIGIPIFSVLLLLIFFFIGNATNL